LAELENAMRDASRSTEDQKSSPTTACPRAFLVPKSFQDLAETRASPILIGFTGHVAFAGEHRGALARRIDLAVIRVEKLWLPGVCKKG
jgi:hypothetical protein